jgi:hypothetical protein
VYVVDFHLLPSHTCHSNIEFGILKFMRIKKPVSIGSIELPGAFQKPLGVSFILIINEQIQSIYYIWIRSTLVVFAEKWSSEING